VLTQTRTSVIDTYTAWNDAIAGLLLDGAFAGAPVYLHLEPDLLQRVAEAAGHASDDDPRTSLAEAVRRTLALDRADDPFLWHIAMAERWEEDGRPGPPPFLALLAVLVLAAEDMVADAKHASHNYYARLIALLDVDEALEKRIRRHFPDTVEFWGALNDWLEEWEGERGLPTAQVLDRRIYISYPLSQALVREVDRRRMHDAFAEYGLVPGRRIAPAEMRHYLDDWLGHGAASTRLGRLWAAGDSRERLVAIACGELAAWTGRESEARQVAPSSQQRLAWAAELEDGPLPILNLYLTARADAERVNGRYDIVPPSDTPARQALSACAEEIEFIPLPGCELASIEPWSKIGVASLLAGALRLARREHPRTELILSPDPLIVLSHDPRDGWYREVGRAQLLERCMVLAHADRAPKVRRHLEMFARPGFRQLEPGTIEGLPVGWTLFLDVVIALPASEEDHEKVRALCPAPANSMSLNGGLQMGPNTWHVDAPPEVAVTLAENQAFTLQAKLRRAISEDADDLDLGPQLGHAAFTLAGRGMEVADYDVQAVAGGGASKEQLLARASLRLRNADQRRPAAADARARFGFPLDTPRGLLGASSLGDGEQAIRGGLLEPPGPSAGVEPRLTLPAQPLSAASERPCPPGARSSRFDDSLHTQSCAARGYHFWICETGHIGENARTLKRMDCRDCQRSEMTLNRGTIKRSPQRARRPIGSAETRPRMAALPRTAAATRPILDTLLDAATYVGAGSWELFKQMTAALTDAPLAAWQAARTLSALGHFDLALDPSSFRIQRWQIAPSCLVETSDGSWVLAGGRSDSLIDAIEGRLGERASIEESALGPTVLRATMTASEAAELVAGLTGPHGEPIQLSPGFSHHAASRLPTLASLLPLLEEARMGSRDLERFDLASGAWRPAGDLPRAGAHRIELHGRLHGVATREDAAAGRMRVVEVLAAKHLAAAHGRVSLVGYDREAKMLTTPMGADLPGVLDRVATLCSGTPPAIHAEAGIVAYHAVPPIVAARIQACLGIV
jgi:hypothetical protein